MTQAINYNAAQHHPFEKLWYLCLVIYLIIYFTRVHDLAGIGFLRPGMILTLILAFFFILSNRIDIVHNKQILLILLFTLLLVIFVPFTKNHYYAFQTAKVMLLMLPFLLSIVILMNDRQRLNSFIWLFVFFTVFNAVYALTHGGRGVSGVVADENDLALFIVTFLPFSFFLLAQRPAFFKKIMLLAVIALSIVAVVATWSRGGFVGLVAMLGVYFWFSQNKVKILIFIAILIGILFAYGGEEYVDRISEITEPGEGTAQARIQSWKAGWDMFVDNPLGVGGNNYPMHFPDYQSDWFSRDMWGRVAHSLWFTLIPETGIIGILIFSSLLITNFKYIFFLRRSIFVNNMNKNTDQHDKYYFHLSTAFIASFAGFFAAATFLSVLYYPQFWLLTVLVFSVRNTADRELQQAQQV